MAARCEDFPCCGHTDGLPCDWTPPPLPRPYIPGWDDDEDEDCSELGHALCENGRCIECGDCEAECGGSCDPFAPC
jgi:hypothetical protein